MWTLLWIIIVALLVVWLAGIFLKLLGAFIWAFLVVAGVLLIIRLLGRGSGRRAKR